VLALVTATFQDLRGAADHAPQRVLDQDRADAGRLAHGLPKSNKFGKGVE